MSPVLYSRSLLAIYFICRSVYVSVLVSQIIPPPVYLLITRSLFLHLWLYFCFVDKFICIPLFWLDSTYEQYRVRFIFLCLTYFTQYDNLQVYSCCCKCPIFWPHCKAWRIFPNQRWNPHSLQWKCSFPTTGTPGKSLFHSFLWLSNIPLYTRTVTSSSIPLLRDI